LARIKEKENEIVKEINSIFSKIDVAVLLTIRPINETALVFYSGAFDPHFNLLLRENNFPNLRFVFTVILNPKSSMLNARKMEGFEAPNK
jgi:hypothetical protein